MASTQYFFLIFPTQIILILYIFSLYFLVCCVARAMRQIFGGRFEGLIFNEIKGNDDTLSNVARTPVLPHGGGSRTIFHPVSGGVA
jgi:hypothetical protein